MTRAFLTKGNGHQHANRKKALNYLLSHIDGVIAVDERTVDFPPYGRCHFSAYTHAEGAMISTPGRGDEVFGSADWHARDRIMMFRDFGDGRCMIYVCPIKPLFGERTIGQHGVRWPDILKHAEFKQVFRTE
ncbi:hypothetical protein [Caulobacter sp. LARHSG274]